MTHPPKNTPPFHISDFLWDVWCIASVVGIWPRFIEPNILQTTRHRFVLPNCPEGLHGLKIVQFSDLHFQKNFSTSFLKQLVQKIRDEKPDILIFTGDFICSSQLEDEEQAQLLNFLNALQAPYGCYAVLGNHDYADYVSINAQGQYDTLQEDEGALITRGFNRLFSRTKLTKEVTPRAAAVGHHLKLIELLKKSHFQLLENENRLIPIKDSFLNICGLGEYTLAKANPSIAFQDYNPAYPGIILVHNPDAIPLLKEYPGEIVLCGHTHGGQVNLPWMWTKFTLMENPQFKRGVIPYHGKWIYVNRGVGSVMQFRWFAIPEILALTLA